MQNIPKRRRMH